MFLDGTFGVTDSLIKMLREYGRVHDLVKAGPSARLKSSTFKKLEKEIAKLNEENLDNLFLDCSVILEEDFKKIIEDTLGLTLVNVEVAKLIATEEEDEDYDQEVTESSLVKQEEYFIRLTTKEHGSCDIAINSICPDIRPNISEMIKERPLLCWLLDSRSPFYLEDFADRIRDVTTILNFRGVLASNLLLQGQIIEILSTTFRGELH